MPQEETVSTEAITSDAPLRPVRSHEIKLSLKQSAAFCVTFIEATKIRYVPMTAIGFWPSNKVNGFATSSAQDLTR